MGVFWATRSPNWRTFQFFACNSGMCRRRPHKSLDESLLASDGHLPVQIRPHTAEALEVLIDKRLRFVPANAELSGEGKCTLSIQRGEVDRLRLAPLLGRHPVEGNVEDD